MRTATLLLVGYSGPLQLSLPVPDGRTLSIGQTIRLPGDGLAVIELVDEVGGRLIATAHELEPVQASDFTDPGSGAELPVHLDPHEDQSESD